MAYKEKIMEILPVLPPGEVYDAFVYHDDWCKSHKGKECDCKPDIKIKRREK
jgi:hypothetical protein